MLFVMDKLRLLFVFKSSNLYQFCVVFCSQIMRLQVVELGRRGFHDLLKSMPLLMIWKLEEKCELAKCL